MAQRFFSQDPENKCEIFSDTLDGINIRCYAEQCDDPDMHGRYHLLYQVIDVRDPSRPVLVNQDVIYNPDYCDAGFDGHYKADMIDKALAAFVEVVHEANASADTYDNWIRGIYAAPLLGMAVTAIAGAMFDSEDELHADQGSHDEPLPDMLGGFDLNGLLE